MTFRQEAKSADEAIALTREECATLGLTGDQIVAVMNEGWERDALLISTQDEISALRRLVRLADGVLEGSVAPLSGFAVVSDSALLTVALDRALTEDGRAKVDPR